MNIHTQPSGPMQGRWRRVLMGNVNLGLEIPQRHRQKCGGKTTQSRCTGSCLLTEVFVGTLRESHWRVASLRTSNTMRVLHHYCDVEEPCSRGTPSGHPLSGQQSFCLVVICFFSFWKNRSHESIINRQIIFLEFFFYSLPIDGQPY